MEGARGILYRECQKGFLEQVTCELKDGKRPAMLRQEQIGCVHRAERSPEVLDWSEQRGTGRCEFGGWGWS